MKIEVSVLICSHNPFNKYLERALNALKLQSLEKGAWELLLVDNRSDHALSDNFDLSWHPLGRHIREDELGLTPARLHGISEAKGKLVILVDDDNALAPSYIEEALRIHREFPQLGVFGGSAEPDYESLPPKWMQSWLTAIALRHVDKAQWSNLPSDIGIGPFGAGMCVRREVAQWYAQGVESDRNRRRLSRVGASMSSGGDSDIVWSALILNYGIGLFPELSLIHFIPARRTEVSYLKRLVEGISESEIYLYRAHKLRHPSDAGIFIYLIKAIRYMMMCPRGSWGLHIAKIKGTLKGRRNRGR